ncbi:DUF3455 domain-containing protein [Hydrogenophaga sp.]|uniref:DUF3455 domain-containing protein n=1 Tax=Hydrogenophaga sp. TaxID=1904254 RepID=UPI0035B332FD
MSSRLPLTIALGGAVALVLGACASSPSMAPFSQTDLPAAVQVPVGHRVAFETAAAGDITYECRAKKEMAGQYEWFFVGPDAGLKGRKGERLGKYYGPPATWEMNDGSKLTGAQLAVAPNGSANIPLQLVKANPAMGSGMAQGVSHIQRVATKGGVAPTAPCDAATLGSKRVVTYTADYIFWKPA